MPTNHLVLIPGLLCTERLFAEQIDALGGTTSIAVADHRGHDTMAGLAAAALAAAPRRFALAGLSMGGYVAFEILRQAPERVERLALMDTSARPDSPEQTENRKRLVALAKKKGVAVPAREMLAKLVAPAHAGDPALVSVVLEMAEATGDTAFARQQSAIASRADSRSTLAQIRCPTLVLVGEMDALTPPDVALEMAEGIAGSALRVVPGAGHLSSLEAPVDVTNALKIWLAA